MDLVKGRRLLLLAVAAVVIASPLSACGSDDGAGTRDVGVGCEVVGDPDAADSTVRLTLREWVIEVDGEASPGSVAFEAANDGTTEHEVVVVRAGSPDALPTDDDGALDEDALPDGALIGEIAPFPPGQTCASAFALEAGSYVLLCNLAGHFSAGMAAAIDVA